MLQSFLSLKTVGDEVVSKIAWFLVIFGTNITSDISKLLYIILRVVSEIWDNFEISRVAFMLYITYKSCHFRYFSFSSWMCWISKPGNLSAIFSLLARRDYFVILVTEETVIFTLSWNIYLYSQLIKLQKSGVQFNRARDLKLRARRISNLLGQ